MFWMRNKISFFFWGGGGGGGGYALLTKVLGLYIYKQCRPCMTRLLLRKFSMNGLDVSIYANNKREK